jgi:hypothetical protein
MAGAEEEFFHQHNRALIERKRREIEARRAVLEKEAKRSQHWMKCPKCGHDMEEISLAGIMVDQCSHCQGVYFDKEEVEIVLESTERGGFLKALSRLF